MHPLIKKLKDQIQIEVDNLDASKDSFTRAHRHGLNRALYLISQLEAEDRWSVLTPDGRCRGCGSANCKDPHIEKHEAPGTEEFDLESRPLIETDHFCKACGERCILTIRPVQPYGFCEAYDPKTGDRRFWLISTCPKFARKTTLWSLIKEFFQEPDVHYAYEPRILRTGTLDELKKHVKASLKPIKTGGFTCDDEDLNQAKI